MATEIDRNKIGSLFGGEVQTVNYNFQSGSESPTCTLTIISKNNEFLIPEMNELVNVPPFGLNMRVLKTSIRQDPLYKVLQVELVDSLSFILDTELVMVFGKDTDLKGNLSKEDGFYVNKAGFLPKSAYLEGSIFNGTYDYPQFRRNYIKRYKNRGVNVIGFPRYILREQTSQPITLDPDLKTNNVKFEETKWLVYDAGHLNRSLSNHQEAEKYGLSITGIDPDSGSVSYGYTFSDLTRLIRSLGLSISGDYILQDRNILITESGTLRQVLTSALSKVGRSFYVDPFTQKIRILNNFDVANINNNINKKYLNFSNTEAAEQLNLTKSIKEVTASHFLVDADLDPVEREEFDITIPNATRKHVLHQLKPKSINPALVGSAADLFLLASAAMFVAAAGEATSDEDLNLYIMSLQASDPDQKRGKQYGENEVYDTRSEETSRSEGEWADE